jgi:hypothetical protein
MPTSPSNASAIKDTNGQSALLGTNAAGTDILPVKVDASGNLLTTPAGAVPATATQITASSGNVAASVAAATLTGAAGRFTFISGFEVTASGSTVALPVTVTVTGTISGTLSYTFTFPAGVLVGANPLVVEYTTPIQSSAVNTNIVVSCPSGGAGNTNATVTAHGYLL